MNRAKRREIAKQINTPQKLERIVDAQETQLDYLKKELKEMNDKYNKLEFKVRVNSVPLDYNPCR